MTAFRIFLIVFALVPLFFGVTGILFGAHGMIAVAPENYEVIDIAPLDNQFRYLSGVYVGLSAMLFYCASGPCMTDPRRALLYRGIVFAIFIGGCARVLSTLAVGQPPLEQMVGMFLELGVPLTLIWQAKLSK